MKSANFGKALTLVAVLAITLTSGCRKRPVSPTPLPGARAGAGAGIADPAPGLATGDQTGVVGDPWGGVDRSPLTPDTNIAFTEGPLDRSAYAEDRAALAQETVFFDFDSSVVKTSEMPKVRRVVDYLLANPQVGVEVEGHCDERGTEEYNRALGDRRALSVREAVALEGIDPRRVFTISYGEDRPAVLGQTEEAFRQNRRGEFVVLRPR